MALSSSTSTTSVVHTVSYLYSNITSSVYMTYHMLTGHTTSTNNTTTTVYHMLNGPTTLNNTTFTDYYYDNDDCSTLYCIYEERYRIKNYVNLLTLAILLSILSGVGFLGNLLVLVVLLRTKVKQTSIYLMCLLALIDLIACGIVIPGMIANEWHYKFYYDFLCKTWEMLRYFTIPTSAMILVAIAFDRFFVICLAPKKISKLATGIIILIIMVLGIACGVPPILSMGVYAEGEDGTTYNVEYCIKNYLHISIRDMDIYWNIITAIFFFMIMSIVFLYLSIFVVVVRQNRKWNKIQALQPTRSQMGNWVKVSRRQSEMSCNTVIEQLYNTRASTDLIKESSVNNKNTCSSHQRQARKASMNVEMLTDYPSTSTNKRVTSEADNLSKDSETKPRGIKSLQVKEKPQHVTEDKEKPQHVTEDKAKPQHVTEDKEKPQHVTEDKEKPQHVIEDKEKLHQVTEDSEQPSAVKNTNISHIAMATTQNTNQYVNSNSKNEDQSIGKLFKRKSGSRRMHIKTTQVLFTVTIVYIISFLPTFLMSYSLVKNQKVVFYLYFFNNTANPIIYSFMNPRFRQEIRKVLKSCGKWIK